MENDVKGFSCGQCVNHKLLSLGIKKYYCIIRKRSVKSDKAIYCKYFKARLFVHKRLEDVPKSEYDNIPIRSQTGVCFGTSSQCESARYKVKNRRERLCDAPNNSFKKERSDFL